MNELFVALRESAFRRRFHLGGAERRYLATHGLDEVLVQAEADRTTTRTSSAAERWAADAELAGA